MMIHARKTINDSGFLPGVAACGSGSHKTDEDSKVTCPHCVDLFASVDDAKGQQVTGTLGETRERLRLTEARARAVSSSCACLRALVEMGAYVSEAAVLIEGWLTGLEGADAVSDALAFVVGQCGSVAESTAEVERAWRDHVAACRAYVARVEVAQARAGVGHRPAWHPTTRTLIGCVCGRAWPCLGVFLALVLVACGGEPVYVDTCKGDALAALVVDASADAGDAADVVRDASPDAPALCCNVGPNVVPCGDPDAGLADCPWPQPPTHPPFCSCAFGRGVIQVCSP